MRLFLFFLLPIGLAGQTVDHNQLDAYFTKMVRDWNLPGASIGVVKDGELVFTGNYGTKKMGTDQPPDEHTLYAIASNSKAFTSALIGMLVQEGKLDWNDPVQQHLPYFQLYDDWVSRHTTIRDLLSHRVGLGTFSGDNIWYKSNRSAEEIIRRVRHVPQAYDFRAGYGYSNLMYITAGEIIETVTGKSWAENVRERILEPLGMDRTIAVLNELEGKGNFTTPHVLRDGNNRVLPWASWDNVAATGGLISSVSDVAKWMIFNLNHGITADGDTLLTKATRNLVWTPHNNFPVDHTTGDATDPDFAAYGLGWGLGEYRGHSRVSHTGGYDGMITAVTLLPDEHLGVVVLTNGTKSPIRAASYYALDRFLGVVEEKDWSAQYLASADRRAANDTRIADRKTARVTGTQPSVQPEKFVGAYDSDLYGELRIEQRDGELKLIFSHSPDLTATLTHWHYDVWQMHWDRPQAWFSFGTLKVNTDAQLRVMGFDLDVPNDDFFFEEIRARRRS